MEALGILTTDRTHLFPGARLRLDGPDLSEEFGVVILFSDGASVEGALTSASDGSSCLRVDAYRTGAGTEIPVRAWELSRQHDGALRVIGPLNRRT